MEKQYKILYDDNFDRDINKIEDYFYDYNSIDLISRIKEDIEYLKFMPRIHKTLYSVKDPMGEYRRIVSGKFIIIYKIDQDKVIILRIFSHKQDYLNSENFILREESEIYNKGEHKMRNLRNSFSRERVYFTHTITEEEALERYMIKLIDEAEEYLANGGETITLEEWQEEIRREYNIAI